MNSAEWNDWRSGAAVYHNVSDVRPDYFWRYAVLTFTDGSNKMVITGTKPGHWVEPSRQLIWEQGRRISYLEHLLDKRDRKVARLKAKVARLKGAA